MTANRQKTCKAVLLVEDDPLIRWSGVDLLQEAGFDAVEAQDADEALSILESRSDVLLLVTDVDMPGSMDGLALASIVRRRWPDLQIIISSGRCELAGNCPSVIASIRSHMHPKKWPDACRPRSSDQRLAYNA